MTLPLDWTTPRDDDLGLRSLESASGLKADFLPNGTLFALSYARDGAPILLNQILGSPQEPGIGGFLLRVNGKPVRTTLAEFGISTSEAVWRGAASGLAVTQRFWVDVADPIWFRRIEIENTGSQAVEVQAILVQDIGLGERGFLMGNEAYASQYTDFAPLDHARFGRIIACRQNLAQSGGRHPWLAIGCVQGARHFATDGLEIFGTRWRDGSGAAFEHGLPDSVLQHEMGCVALGGEVQTIPPSERYVVTFFGRFVPDHAEASGPSDLALLDDIEVKSQPANSPPTLNLRKPTLFETAPIAIARSFNPVELEAGWPARRHEETQAGTVLSFFVDDGSLNRHVVCREKEFLVRRRHGAMVRSGTSLLLDEDTLCATGWMHGVFAAQLTIGNTSFHKLFSVSRDPYNVTRSSGLRVFVERDAGWELLAVPSAFEIGLQDCRWIYQFGTETITLHAYCSAERPALRLDIEASGGKRRFLITGHLVLGEREYDHRGRVEIDATRKQAILQPDPEWLWAQKFPQARYLMVSSTPEAVEAIGGDELLGSGEGRVGSHIVFRTTRTNRFNLAITGSMLDAAEAERRATVEAAGVTADAVLNAARKFWFGVLGGKRLRGSHELVQTFDTVLPWLAHNALMHVTVPRGLEQYTGAAWGTRDVCQGPLEFYLALGHDDAAREIVRRVFAEQYDGRGDWSQWFMHEPYAFIRDSHAHGDVIVWPLKALNDYVETTGDLTILDVTVPYRRADDGTPTAEAASITDHVALLLQRVVDRFIPGTNLIRYGEGDWNDALQPADPALRDRMVSSWTVALLYQQLVRWSDILGRAGRSEEAASVAATAEDVKKDFRRYLLRDGVLAGYGVFEPGRSDPELLLHPDDQRTGLRYSLLPMFQAILGDLFEPNEVSSHVALIRAKLQCPDGVRLMDHMPEYRGGIERLFRRAESASNVGREIGLLYVHAHLRYGEAMAKLGDAEALWWVLEAANPIVVTECVPNAALRQRNTYFSSSDAAFRTRYEAGREWARVKDGSVPAEGGWRIYSSGPGIYTGILLCGALGQRRLWGKQVGTPLIPTRFGDVAFRD